MFAVLGTKEQYEELLKAFGLEAKQAHWLHNPNVLIGTRGVTILLLPGWESKSWINDMIDMMKARDCRVFEIQEVSVYALPESEPIQSVQGYDIPGGARANRKYRAIQSSKRKQRAKE